MVIPVPTTILGIDDDDAHPQRRPTTIRDDDTHHSPSHMDAGYHASPLTVPVFDSHV